MKRIIFVMLLASLLFCTRDKQPAGPCEIYFDPQHIDLLELADVPGFWQGDSVQNISAGAGVTFSKHAGFLKGVRYSGEVKSISLAVFKNRHTAIEAMELLINDVACVIIRDSSGTCQDLCWFSDCIPNLVFINKWNTIITIGYYHPNFSDVKMLLYDTAFEIGKRVNRLCN